MGKNLHKKISDEKTIFPSSKFINLPLKFLNYQLRNSNFFELFIFSWLIYSGFL